MALFEDESMEDLENENANVYLDDPRKGMELVKSMLFRQREKISYTEFDTLVSDGVFPILARMDIKNELEIYRSLVKIGDKIREQQKIKLLEGKKVLGIGGKFSAGKSCFINSITNAELPEGQRPTTSIATYVLNADEKENIAILNNDNIMYLDDDAVSALTHQFFEKYQIGFSRVVRNLVVHTPNFTYPNVAILDTPGYSKSDALKEEDSSDAGMAREQLRSVDYLIWLVDAVQGVVTQKDLDFISSLNVDSQILVVFTKASLEIEENLIKKIQTAKEALSGINKKIFDVIAYDSLSGETIVGKGVLEKFLQMVNNAKEDDEGIAGQIGDIRGRLDLQITEQVREIRRQYKELEKVLARSSNVEHISSIIREYAKCQSSLLALEENRKDLSDILGRLIYIINTMKAV